MWEDRADYVLHVLATMRGASIGFAVGNSLAIVFALLFRFVPPMRTLMGLLTFLFSIPLIVLVPIVGMAFDPEIAKIICSVLLVYYPTLLIVSVALSNVEPSLIDTVLAAGGSERNVFQKLRIPYAIAGLAVGLQTAAPSAILGSMLGEFTGARWGLGTYLLATMAQAKPAKEWGVFLVCAGLAALAYWLVGLILKPLRVPVAIGTHNRHPLLTRVSKWKGAWAISARAALSVLVTLLVWQLCANLIDVPQFAKGPVELLRYANLLPMDAWQSLGLAFAQTLAWAGVGLLVGLGTAFLLAVAFDFQPTLAPSVLPLALVSQTVPIVALIPLFVALLGRGTLATLAVTTSATFFPSFVTIYQGLRRTPRPLIDVLRASGAARGGVLFKAKLPSAIPFVCAAARLAAPRVILGVTLAEYLITRRALGSLIFEARGKLDFGMMWLIAAGTGLVSIFLYSAVRHLELRFAPKYGSGTGANVI